MIRNLKALGLALVAVFAMSAIAASAAQAGHYTGGANPTILDGSATTNQVFETESELPLTCTTVAAGAGTEIPGGTATTITVNPVYTNCSSLVNNDTTVTMNGCDYTFTEPTTNGGNADLGTIPVDLHCPAGHKIEVHIYTSSSHATSFCTVTIFPWNEAEGEEATEQSVGTVSYENTTSVSPKVVHVTANISGLSYTEHGALCPDGNTVLKHNGVYRGSITVSGTSEAGASVNVEVS